MSIEIELVTTKKKLSKSVVNQMEMVNIVDFNLIDMKDYDTVLGYYIDKNERIAIVKVVNDYKRVVLRDWKPTASTVRPELYCNNMYWSFESYELRTTIYTMYNRLKQRALLTHIYL